MEIFIAAVVIIAVVLILYMSLRKKKQKPEERPVQNLLVPEEDSKTPDTEPPSPVTFTEDLDFSFDGINSDLEDALTEHSLFFADQSAFKPEYNAPKAPSAAPAPKAPSVNAAEYLRNSTVITEEDASVSEKVMKIIRSFISGNYYFDGEMIANGEKSPMEIAMQGNDFQVFSVLDGKDIAIMQYESKTYMLNPDTKKYTELSASFQKMVGINTSDLKFSFNSIGVDPDSPEAVKKATFNGNDAVCITYRNDRTVIEFIVSEDEILQMTLYDTNSAPLNILIADEFTDIIPGDMLTFKGYSKTNMIMFLKALM